MGMANRSSAMHKEHPTSQCSNKDRPGKPLGNKVRQNSMASHAIRCSTRRRPCNLGTRNQGRNTERPALGARRKSLRFDLNMWFLIATERNTPPCMAGSLNCKIGGRQRSDRYNRTPKRRWCKSPLIHRSKRPLPEACMNLVPHSRRNPRPCAMQFHTNPECRLVGNQATASLEVRTHRSTD